MWRKKKHWDTDCEVENRGVAVFLEGAARPGRGNRKCGRSPPPLRPLREGSTSGGRAGGRPPQQWACMQLIISRKTTWRLIVFLPLKLTFPSLSKSASVERKLYSFLPGQTYELTFYHLLYVFRAELLACLSAFRWFDALCWNDRVASYLGWSLPGRARRVWCNHLHSGPKLEMPVVN